MFETVTILVAAGTMFVLAVAMSSVLGWANRAFHVEVDPRIEAISEALPGANCGGCGFVGCGEYAEAIVQKGAPVNLCPPGGPGTAAAVADIMGVEVGEAVPKQAVVRCGGSRDNLAQVKEYRGEGTCAAAALVGGIQSCAYGCLGLGDCVAACAYDAIHVFDGLAVVDYDRCIGCAACAKVCPRHLIEMVPFHQERMPAVLCSNPDFGADVKKVCKVGCIGCSACRKAMPEVFEMAGKLARIREDCLQEPPDIGPAMEKCPTGCIGLAGREG